MDACIAESVSQRTAYILKTIGQTLSLNSKVPHEEHTGTQRASKTFDSGAESTRHGGNKVKADLSAADQPHGYKVRGANSITTRSTSSLNSKVRSSKDKSSEKKSKVPSSERHTTMGHGYRDLMLEETLIKNYAPNYETFYSPKCYQPLPVYNFPSSTSSASLASSKNFATGRYGISSGHRPHTPYSSTSFAQAGGPPSQPRDVWKSTSGVSYASSGYDSSRSLSGGLDWRRDMYPDTANSLTAGEKHQETKNGRAVKGFSDGGEKETKYRKASAAGCLRKSSPDIPNHNNNFYKGSSCIFFDNRKKMAGAGEDLELSGQDRINILAQPKQYPCQHTRPYDGRKLSACSMERINHLAQPKLCHYTVCSCCLSPNCLGECATRISVNKSSCRNPSFVDWDRLATPRRNTLPPNKVIGEVKSSALKVTINKRIERLSIPRKVINSGDYYLWLWNKKPDVQVYLKPIRRLAVDKCDLKDVRVLLRCDLDFTTGKPIDCKVRDALPTMQLALKKGAKSIVIISRCGPEGIAKDPIYSLKPLAQVFQQYLETNVVFLDDCVGFQAQALCEDPVPGSVFLLENLAFHTEELGYMISNDEKLYSKKEDVARFQKIISDLGDIYISDSFNELVTMTNTTVGYPPKDFGFGFNIKKELSIFNKFAIKPPVPVLAIVTGPFQRMCMVLRNLMGQVSDILIGGQLAAVFTKAIKHCELGNTDCNEKMEKKALKLFSRAKDTQTTLHLPSDVVVKNLNTDDYYVALTRDDIDQWMEIVDIGPHTRKCYMAAIQEAAAIIWLGDFGPLADGTEAILTAYLQAARNGTPTYAADDIVKHLVSVVSQPNECLFVTGDGEATETLLRGQTPKGLAAMSKSRKKFKREPQPEALSTKPLSYELPGEMIAGGTKTGISYGASDSHLCINHIPVENLKVLIRVEFNEPMYDNQVTNNYRMRMTIPTIKYALKWRARAVVVLAHFREPQGRRDGDLTLKPICDEMATLLGETVTFIPRTVGKDVMTTINQVHPGSVLMVENVRFQPEEEQGFLHLPDGRVRPSSLLSNPSNTLPSGFTAEMNAQFCEELSRLGDIYVNDAFSALHLDHASITGSFRPVRVCGFLVKNELKYLAKLLNYPSRKFLVVLGGTHIEDKMDILPGILKEADSVILAGMMACLFLKVEHGLKTGRMLFSYRLQERAKEMVKLAVYYKCRIHYPVDLAVSADPDGKTLKQVSISEGIPKGHEFVDIGKLSASMFTRIIKRKNMIFWTGVTGNGRIDYERSSTKQLMEALKEVTHDPEKSAVTIVGGRGLCQVVEKHDPDHESFTHLTTGGRTALQLLGERHVIGLEPLLPKPGKRPLSLLSVSDYPELRDAIILLRCDLDIPMVDGTPVNMFPLQHLLETIRYLQKKGVKVIVLLSGSGDPDGEFVEKWSLSHLKPSLESFFEQPVEWVPEGVSPEAEAIVQSAGKGTIVLLENINFHPEEGGYTRSEAGNRVPVSHDDMSKFRTRLTSLGDIFVNESFGSLHRSYSSVVGVSRRPCLAGISLKRQVYDYVDIRRQLGGHVLLILGTEELDDIFYYLLILYNALDFVETVYLCGNMAAVFKTAAAQSTVKELKDAQLIIPRIQKKARLKKIQLAQVTDSLAAKDPSNPEEEPRTVHLESSLPRGYQRCDMGPASVNALTAAIHKAKTILLCGVTGPVVYDHHMRGTKGILDQIAAVTGDETTTSVALGMRTGQFLQQCGHTDSFTGYSVNPEPFFHIMTRRPLPGLQVLDRMPPNLLKKLSIEQMNLSNKRVLLRLDLDVPSVEGVVLDTDKLEDAAQTINYALNQGAKCVVLLGHRGEPGGYKNYYLKMEPLVVEISAILGMDVTLIDRPCSRKAISLLEDPPQGSVFLMENLKFYPAESGVDAEKRERRPSKRAEASLTEVSELPKDEKAAADTGNEQDNSAEEAAPSVAAEGGNPADQEEDSVSDDGFTVSDGEEGHSVDSLMYQLMRPKTVEQFINDLAACGDVFINDDVAHVEEPLTSYQGFGLPERGCGLLLAEFLRDSEDASVYQLPGVEALSPAP